MSDEVRRQRRQDCSNPCSERAVSFIGKPVNEKDNDQSSKDTGQSNQAPQQLLNPWKCSHMFSYHPRECVKGGGCCFAVEVWIGGSVWFSLQYFHAVADVIALIHGR